MRYFTLLLVLGMSANSWAIKYYQSSDDSIKEINAVSFDSCKKIYYRNVAKKELSIYHQKNLVNASLKGEVVNDPDAVALKLKKENGACTYGSDHETLK